MSPADSRSSRPVDESKAMREWFDSIQPREQIAVIVATAFVVFAILWFGVWQPLDRGQTKLAESVGDWERALTELRPLKAQLLAGGGTAPVVSGDGQSLVVIVDTSLGMRNLSRALQRSQPTGANAIRVEFQDASFDDLIRWLGDLSTRYGLQVRTGNFSLSSQSVPGRVNASVTLER